MKAIVQIVFSVIVIWLAVNQPEVRQVARLLVPLGADTNVASVGLPELSPDATAVSPAAPAEEPLSSPAAGSALPAFPPLTAKFALGESGAHVKQLQEMLTALGFYSGEPSGQYDQATVAAVTAFQQQNGISTTPETAGLAGPGTRTAINKFFATEATAPAPTPTPASAAPTPDRQQLDELLQRALLILTATRL